MSEGERARQPDLRTVRTYVRREGRMTRAQRRALETLWPRYGLEPGEGLLDLAAAFGRHAPRALEIGFGMGDALLEMASARPGWDFLGVEVYRPGAGSLIRRAHALGLGNIRVVLGDAVLLLERHLPPASLDAVYVFFPDPWPKKRHHKRRLVQPAFAARVARVLKPGGVLHLATDWEPYAEHMLAVMEAAPGFRNLAGPGRYLEGRGDRPETKFERRGRALGHPVRDLLYVREAGDEGRETGRKMGGG